MTNSRKTKYKTVESIVEKLRQVHGDKYDYSKVDFGNKITLICPKHGEWTAARSDVFRGSGCIKCRPNRTVTTTESLVERFKEVWGDKYDYSKVNFTGWRSRVTIICPKHGEATVVPGIHLLGGGPMCCKGDRCGKKNRHTKEKFVEIANAAHNNKYDYSKVEYRGASVKVAIICPKHGEFWQTPDNHKMGHGCPKCASAYANSSTEQLVSSWFPGKFLQKDRTLIKPKEVDLLSHKHKLAIEVNGAYWHSADMIPANYHLDKTVAVEDKGYQLLHFWDFEVKEKPTIVRSIIASKMGLTERLYARKCVITKIPCFEASFFLNNNHLQGSSSGVVVAYGLLHEGRLVAAMTFGKPRFDKTCDWEMLRFATLCGISVIGGASRLFNMFAREHSGTVVSYANRRISNGNLYNRLGFVCVGKTQPSYFWLSKKNGVRHSRYKCQKHKLKDLLGDNFVETESEAQNMERNGFVKCFDCGNLKYEYKIQN